MPKTQEEYWKDRASIRRPVLFIVLVAWLTSFFLFRSWSPYLTIVLFIAGLEYLSIHNAIKKASKETRDTSTPPTPKNE